MACQEVRLPAHAPPGAKAGDGQRRDRAKVLIVQGKKNGTEDNDMMSTHHPRTCVVCVKFFWCFRMYTYLYGSFTITVLYASKCQHTHSRSMFHNHNAPLADYLPYWSLADKK